MTIKYTNLTGREKEIEIPDHAYGVHFGWGSWKRDCGVYLWWKEYGISKCKLISATKWYSNLKHFKDQIKPQLKNEL